VFGHLLDEEIELAFPIRCGGREPAVALPPFSVQTAERTAGRGAKPLLPAPPAAPALEAVEQRLGLGDGPRHPRSAFGEAGRRLDRGNAAARVRYRLVARPRGACPMAPRDLRPRLL